MSSRPWPRAIILVDMNAFFAAIEQQDHPEWRGRPVAITNGLTGTCIITSSYEARAHGIKTGMHIREGRKLCPGLIQCPAHPTRYTRVSSAIMSAMQDITPEVEVFSVDEAFLDVTHCQRLLGPPEKIARLVKRKVFDVSGLQCSVGVSGDRTTAKYAAKLDKPDGFTAIHPDDARERLRNVPVTELCGINRGIGNFLAQRGVHVCGDMEKLPIGVLAKRFGNPGRRIWYMCQGADPEPLQLNVPPPKSIGHGKVMPPDTRDIKVVLMFLLHMSEKVAARLRRHAMVSKHFFIGLRAKHEWLALRKHSELPTDDSRVIMSLCRSMVEERWQGEGVFQVQVTALSPYPLNGQMELFSGHNDKRHTVNRAMDAINNRYGEFTLAPARLAQRSDMPNVIAPSWKPFGHRQTIQDEKVRDRAAGMDSG